MADFIGRPAKKPESGKRKHDKSDPVLKAEMKRVFAERFEKKHGQNLPVSVVYTVFRESTSLTEISFGVFKRNCRTMFLSQWTHSKVIGGGDKRFFADMAVDYSEVYVLELAQNKVYVGVSDDVERSIQEHLEGNGCDFTRMYETTAVLLPRLGTVTGTIEEQHRDETLRNMLKYGIVNVRGWKYSSVVMSQANEAMADIVAHLREIN